MLESVDGQMKLEAADEEPNVRGDRLDLLAVVRGLEALDQPSRVTLVTPSAYVSRGLRSGMEQWKEAGWQWERFGEMAPIKNYDLWRRIDQALKYHEVEVRNWRLDPPARAEKSPQVDASQPVATNSQPRGRVVWKTRALRAIGAVRRLVAETATRFSPRRLPGRQSVVA